MDATEAAIVPIDDNEFTFVCTEAQSPWDVEKRGVAVSVAKPVLAQLSWPGPIEGSQIPTCSKFSHAIVHPVCE